MQRVFTRDIPGREGRVFRRKGDVVDWPRETWEGVCKAACPKIDNFLKALDSISRPVADLAAVMK